jgi:hypothetical protein
MAVLLQLFPPVLGELPMVTICSKFPSYRSYQCLFSQRGGRSNGRRVSLGQRKLSCDEECAKMAAVLCYSVVLSQYV